MKKVDAHMMYHLLKPEVPGEFGDNIDLDTSVHPPRVSVFHLSITDWLGDELLESFPCFAVTTALADKLTDAELTGFALADMEVTMSEEAYELMGDDAETPQLKWLQITGRPGHDDFGQTAKAHLVVSDRALETLRTHTLEHCVIQSWEPPSTESV
ncbi:hypothetical protein [Stackebrandtia nassauensis]|nr:hypothetical protein [Stackebrandtia nassauensis]